MASDHLRISIEFLSGGPLKQRGLLLYSPSTVTTLKEELSHAHGVPSSEIMVYFDGGLLEDKTRIVDKRLYHIRLPPKWTDPLAEGVSSLGKGVVAVDKSVTFEDGVHVDSMVTVEEEPRIDARIYMAFAFSGYVRLFDVTSGVILSPLPFLRLGYSVVYADWGRLRPLTKDLAVEPTTWLYDRLRRDYGILPTSSIFGLHTAPLTELRRYRTAVEHWISSHTATEGEPGRDNVLEEEDEEEGEEEDMEEDMDLDLDLDMEEDNEQEWWK